MGSLREVMRDGMQQNWSNDLHSYTYNNKDEKQGDFLDKMELPHELIVYDIVTRLPIKCILQCKSISKQWYSSISSSNFGNAHFKISKFFHPFSPINCVFIHSRTNFFLYFHDEDNANCDKGLLKLDLDYNGLTQDDIILIGSCNGLICFYSLLGYIIIWNPIIHQCAKFQYPLFEVSSYHFTWGFGYVSSKQDYRVVRISESHETKEVKVHIFSLRTHKWTHFYNEKLQEFSLRGMMPRMAGALINETLYWIMYRRGLGEKQGILSFDLAHERFDEIRGLIPSDSYLSSFRFLGCVAGCLAMGRFTHSGDVSISILKQKGQIEYIGFYRNMNLCSCSSVIGNTKDGKFFIQLGDQEFGLVNPNSSPKEYTRIVTFRDQGNTRVLGYTPSLVSPFGVAQESSQGIRNTRSSLK